MEITYNHVAPHIVSTEIEGTKMHCEFRTPTGEIIRSSARLKRTKSIQGQLQRKVTRQVSRKARRQASRVVRGVLGGGMLGRLGSQIVRSSTSDDNLGISNFTYTTLEKQEAIIEAFRKIEEYFDFDQQSHSFKAPISRKSKSRIRSSAQLSAFEKQMNERPIESAYDREILARMLVELANADGSISVDEREFLDSIIGSEYGHIDDLLEKDPISQIECEEVSDKAKASIYMLSWVMSLIDYDLDFNEKEILMEYAEMFGFNENEKEELIKAAKFYIIETSLSTSTARAELYDFADKIELDRNEAERCLIQMKKRS